MKRNCEIPVEQLISAKYRTYERYIPITMIKVDTDTMAAVAEIPVSTLKAWTISGVFGDKVTRVGRGQRGSYYLYDLDDCWEIIKGMI